VSATRHHPGPALRRLPSSAKLAATEKAAQGQFARTFADVLSGRFGGRWTVEWERADGPAPSTDRDRRPFSDEE
jgi:hypothetical protein